MGELQRKKNNQGLLTHLIYTSIYEEDVKQFVRLADEVYEKIL